MTIRSRPPMSARGDPVAGDAMQDLSFDRPPTSAENSDTAPFRALADVLPQMVWTARARDRVATYGNRRFHEFFGPDGIPGETRAARVHADDRAVVEATIASGAHGLEREIRIRDLEGTYRWHKFVAEAVDGPEGIAGFVCTALDIDDLVKARQKLQETSDLFSLAQQAAGAGIWDLDLRNGSLVLHRENARLHGIADHAVMIDLDTWRQVVEPDDAEIALAAVQTAIDRKGTYNGEYRVRLADGDVRWLSGIGRAHYDEAGMPVRMIGLNFDITDRKTAEAKLIAAKAEAEEARTQAEAARREAERASSAKTEFLASMSHEIRTPLNAVIGYADLLLEDGRQEPLVRRKLEIIQESGSALLTIVNDVLDFSKIEAGQIELQPVEFAPHTLLDNVVSMLSGLAGRKGIGVRGEIAADVPRLCSGDESRLRQILLNLVNNAIKFTSEGGVVVSVRTVVAGLDGDPRLRFAVTDTGIGISEAYRSRLFQRFSQVDGSITRRFGGTGLGLAISKQLVELMHGAIGVESREGEGSTFWFEVALPVATAGPAQRPKPRQAGLVPAHRAHVLLVEDVAVNRDLACAVLQSEGHSVDVAANGLEAVAKVAKTSYDLVLMDVHMPVMDGLAATQAIRSADHANRHVPIVAMTANVLPQHLAEFKDAGMDDYVGKPFKKAALQAAIQRWAKQPPATVAAEPAEGGDRFDTDVFQALEGMIGGSVFDSVVQKFEAELLKRFGEVTPSSDPAQVASDAHAMISSAGMLGFVRLIAILRQLERGRSVPIVLDPLLTELSAELRLVARDLARERTRRETRSA